MLFLFFLNYVRDHFDVVLKLLEQLFYVIEVQCRVFFLKTVRVLVKLGSVFVVCGRHMRRETSLFEKLVIGLGLAKTKTADL
jgi:hypothetical protein